MKKKNRPRSQPTEIGSAKTKKRLQKRSSIDESEGLASTRVRGWEEALARARSGTRFRHFIGRNSIRQNFDQSLRDKVGNSTYGMYIRHMGASDRCGRRTDETALRAVLGFRAGRRMAVRFRVLLEGRPPIDDPCFDGACRTPARGICLPDSVVPAV